MLPEHPAYFEPSHQRQILARKEQPMNTLPLAQPLVMIVEDDDDSRLMMKTLLEMKGFNTVEAGDGVEAVEVAKRERPHLIIMDLQMPRLNGFEVTRHLRRHTETRETPIFIMSGHDPVRHRPLAMAAGCNEYLGKPLDFNLLEVMLGRWLPVV